MQKNQINKKNNTPEQQQQDILNGLSIPKNSYFSTLSHENLLKKAYELEMKNKELTARLAFLQPYKQKQTNPPTNEKQDKLFSKFITKKYALKIAYIGITYNGLAIQRSTDNTIESYLFKSLHSLSLIRNIQPGNDYTRAGRTDRGVSAFGNVVALNLRTSIQNTAESGQNKIHYAKMLNKILPNDIRILSVKEVNEEFNARYWCIERQYKYFFARGLLDLDKMREAIKLYEGTHNFINFCRIDVVATTHYERNITKATIEKVNFSLSSLDKDFRNEIYYFHFRANAFLWHQIRFMASILFLVGSHKQDPSIISDLLNPEKFPKKPNYPIAPEYPLILEDCKYENYTFEIEKAEAIDFYNTFNEMVMRKIIQMTLFINCMMLMKGWVYQTIKLNQGSLINESIEIQQKYFKSKTKKLGLYKSTCIGVEESIQKLKGRRLELFQKRQKKQQEYEERVKNSNKIKQTEEQQFLE